jgi:hypothetical protein
LIRLIARRLPIVHPPGAPAKPRIVLILKHSNSFPHTDKAANSRIEDEGSRHPDRNAQFEHINAKVLAAQRPGSR